MDWYKSLDINHKIAAKECFVLAFGVEFEKLAFMLTLKERINMLHEKLVAEGIL